MGLIKDVAIGTAIVLVVIAVGAYGLMAYGFGTAGIAAGSAAAGA